MKKIFLIFTLLIICSCTNKKENNLVTNAFEYIDFPKFDFNELLSIVETYGEGPPPCILDCNGINTVDLNDGNSFCPWVINLEDQNCTNDCSNYEMFIFSYFASTCLETMKRDQRYEGMINMTDNLMNYVFLNDDFLNAIPNIPEFNQILIDLLPADDKVVSLKYKNRENAQNNISFIKIINKTDEKLRLDWINPNRQDEFKGYIETNSIKDITSFNGHVFKISNINSNKILNKFRAPKGYGIVIIR